MQAKLCIFLKTSLKGLHLGVEKYTFIIPIVECLASFLLQIGIYPATFRVRVGKSLDAFHCEAWQGTRQKIRRSAMFNSKTQNRNKREKRN